MTKYLLTAALLLLSLASPAQQMPNPRNFNHDMAAFKQKSKLMTKMNREDMESSLLRGSNVEANKMWRNSNTITKDANGNITSKADFTYDDRGQMTQRFICNYEDGALVYSEKLAMAYDDNGNPTESVIRVLDIPSNQWMLSSAIYNKYDESNRLVEQSSYNYDSDGILSNASRSTDEYSTNEFGGVSDLFIYSEYVDGEFVPRYAYTYDYDENRQLYARGELNNWDATINGWTNGEKYASLYKTLPNGRAYEALRGGYQWDVKTQKWKLIYEFRYNYDDLGHRTETYEYHQDYEGNIWGYKEVFTYKSDSNDYTVIRYLKENEAQPWQYYLRFEYKFNADSNLCLIEKYNSDNKLEETVEYTWIQIGADPSGVAGAAADKIDIMAGNGTISVSGAIDVSIYTIDGKLVSRSANTNVAPGLYIVKADGNTVKVNVK